MEIQTEQLKKTIAVLKDCKRKLKIVTISDDYLIKTLDERIRQVKITIKTRENQLYLESLKIK